VNIYRDQKDTDAKVAVAFSSSTAVSRFNSRDPKEQKKLIRETFADLDGNAEILAAMEESPDFYFDSMAQIHMPHGRKDASHWSAMQPTPPLHVGQGRVSLSPVPMSLQASFSKPKAITKPLSSATKNSCVLYQ